MCNQTNLLKNISNILPKKVQERVASDIIKKKVDDSGDGEVTLATGAKPLKIDLHKAGAKISEPEISLEHISRMKKRLNLSQNQTLLLAEELRAAHSSMKIVPSHLKAFLKTKLMNLKTSLNTSLLVVKTLFSAQMFKNTLKG
jgi:hypothetical protein